jgi:hypothetical protein
LRPIHSRSVEPAVRSNLVIAVGDLAFRFPNKLEPWTEHMYRPLADTDLSETAACPLEPAVAVTEMRILAKAAK